MGKLKILVFARFSQRRHRYYKDFIIELGKHAHVQVWNKDGWEINYILKTLKMKQFVPDFIFHYDFAYNYHISPRIYGLSNTKILKGVYYIDLQTQTAERKEFVYKNKINLVFSPYKDFFFRTLPELKNKFRWLPFSINPDVYKDWKLQKDTDFLFMGRSWGEWYPFRGKVLKTMGNMEGFVYHKHPNEGNPKEEEVFLGERYAREINRAKIFFTCGTKFNYPVAKYLEVPACNTLLIAKGNKDLKDLGFVNGKNFVECTDDNFYDLAMYYLKHEEERKRIAENGYNLVHLRHTNSIRVVEFINTIKSYLKT